MFLRLSRRKCAEVLAIAASVLVACDDAPVVQPSPIEGPSPFQYPVALWDRGVQGETVLMVHVTASGEVDSATVNRSSGQDAFDEAAVRGAYKLRFLPGHRGGEKMALWVKFPVRFTRDTAAADTAS